MRVNTKLRTVTPPRRNGGGSHEGAGRVGAVRRGRAQPLGPRLAQSGATSLGRAVSARNSLGKEFNVLSKSSGSWKPKTNVVPPHSVPARTTAPLSGVERFARLSVPLSRDFGGVRVDEVT